VLLERGRYLCSVSTIDRILAERAQVKDRRRLARHPARVRPELIAAGPGQVFTWDITKLRGRTRSVYFNAYLMNDIYSRYIVGACVHVTETAVLAEDMMQEVFTIRGAPQVVNADGAFKTLKYAPVFPDQFGVAAARPLPRRRVRAVLQPRAPLHRRRAAHPADVHNGLSADADQRRRHRCGPGSHPEPVHRQRRPSSPSTAGRLREEPGPHRGMRTTWLRRLRHEESRRSFTIASHIHVEDAVRHSQGATLTASAQRQVMGRHRFSVALGRLD